MDLEFKSAAAEFKFFDEGPGGFTGYASVFGNVDSYGDVVMPGAYAESIPVFLRDGFIAIGHDWGSLAVGYATEAVEDSYGLKLTTAFHSTKEAQDARTVIRERSAAGKSTGLSIGYMVPAGGRKSRDDGVSELHKIDLREVSIVTVPANRAALVTGAKSGPHGGLTLEDHSKAALAVVEDLVARFAVLGELRAKDGRVLSAANRARIALACGTCEEAVSALQDAGANLADLLAATEPMPKGDNAQARQLYAEFLRSMSA